MKGQPDWKAIAEAVIDRTLREFGQAHGIR